MPVTTTTYDYDAQGRLIRSTTTAEPEWTDEDRGWMLALALYRQRLCPRCGGLLKDCTSDHETGTQFRVKRIRCRATDELLAQQEAAQNLDRPGALLWSVQPDE